MVNSRECPGLNELGHLTKNSENIYKRIAVFGLPGAGKSVFADRLSRTLGLPLFHLDKYYFLKGWKKRDYEAYLADEQAILAQEKWIVDGNCMHSIEKRFARAEVIYYFRGNRLKCFFRIVKRMLRPDRHIDDLPDECDKSVTWRLVRYMWQFDQRFGEEIKRLGEKYSGVKLFIVR